MALNNISFVKGKGGLGRPLAGKDYISGLLFYTATLPSGFTSTNRIKQIFSVADAVALGINNTFADETQATGVYTISGAGATGDSITMNYTEPEGKVVVLGTYVKLATDTTTLLVATGIVGAINAGTYLHGYSATIGALGAFTVRARKGLGLYANTVGLLTATIAGTIAGSVTTPFAGGVASLQATWYYHISEFFRISPKGFLWLNFQAVPTTYTYTELQAFQEFTNGAMRQVGIFVDSKALAVADTTAIQSVCNLLDAEKMPLSVLYAGDIKLVTNISTLTDLATLSNNKVSVVVGQDGAGQGNAIYYATGKSVTTLGATLGAVSLSAVSDNIGWVGKFDMSNGVELDTIAFANGVKFTDATITPTLLDAIDLKRYVFLRNFANKAGSFHNDSHTAIIQSSDYAYIENNRVIDKVIRGVDEALTPSLNSPLLLNANGTLSNSTVAFLTGQATVITDEMVRNGEASAVSVTIDPNQNVASTSRVVIAVDIVPVGVARNIVVNIGFKTSI
jgi:hypothetical protein